jgi:AcrR family transcriptional regulator
MTTLRARRAEREKFGLGDRYLRRRVEIIGVAASVFRRRGFHGASVGEIAQALGMTKGNLYYYFRDKEEILFFCHDHSLDLLLACFEKVQASGGPPAERMRGLVVAFVRLIIDELQGTALNLDLDALSAAHREQVIVKRDRVDRILRGVIDEGMEDGQFAPGDAKVLSFVIFGSINWITRWYQARGSRSAEEISQAFADFVLAGLGGTGRLRRSPSS